MTSGPRLSWPVAALAGGACLFLAWQIVVQAAVERTPSATALKLAPGSARALTRAAEAELDAGRPEQAERLAREALAATPFNARAVRVLGISVDRRGDADRGDQLVTLAGNWSLRDGPAHAWLVDRRLRQGRYGSAFAHADALMRRKPELQPQLFKLMRIAVAHEPRALSAVAERLAEAPSWRRGFLFDLSARPEGFSPAMSLALMLQKSRAPLNDDELGVLLTHLVQARQYRPAAELRRRLGRDGETPFDGVFDDRPGPAPFRWFVGSGAGATVEIAPDDVVAGQSALRVEYDGYSTPGLVRQFTALPAGAYELQARWRSETPVAADRLAWVVACAEDGRVVARSVQPAAATPTGWRATAVRFEVPRAGCEGQWLQLKASPGERRTTLVVWYDDVKIRRFSADAEN